MSQKKRSASAAQRREQERQKRRQRSNTGQSVRSQAHERNSRRYTSKKNNPWFLIGGIVVLVAVVIGVFVYLANQPATTSTTGGADAFKTLTSIDPATQSSVGTGSARNLMKAVPPGTPLPKGPTGKPLFFYEGADFCPYCAAMRWPLIASLSRFGTFSQLEPISSAESNVPTFTFYKGTYTSQYVDFVGLETSDNNGKVLDTPTPEQQKLIDTYNAPPYTQSKGSIPFVMIGNQQVSTGAFYDPTILLGLSQQQIADKLKDPNSDIAKAVLGSANYLTAAICAMTNNQPANVCTSGQIPQIQSSLPKYKAALAPGSLQLGSILYQSAWVTRRQD